MRRPWQRRVHIPFAPFPFCLSHVRSWHLSASPQRAHLSPAIKPANTLVLGFLANRALQNSLTEALVFSSSTNGLDTIFFSGNSFQPFLYGFLMVFIFDSGNNFDFRTHIKVKKVGLKQHYWYSNSRFLVIGCETLD